MSSKSMRGSARRTWRWPGWACVLGGGALLLVLVTPAQAVDLSGDNFQLNLDTTLGWGLNARVTSRDLALIGLPAGGTAYSVNADDGNLNFDQGVFSNNARVVSELEFAYKNFGIFARGRAFYDFEIEDDERARTPLSPEALDWVGSRAEMLDYFAWLRFPVGSGSAEIRAGNQVLSWGESTFIQAGINVINPIDLNALHTPGAEIREALLPVGLVWGSLDLTASLAVEGFYQYKWEGFRTDPVGSYWGTSDPAGPGGKYVFLAFASFPDTGESPWYIQPAVDHAFMAVPRSADERPNDGGQYGIALRWFADALGGTEFGLYYLNYHSRLPYFGAVTGTIQGLMAAAEAGPRAAGVIYQHFGVPPGMVPAVDEAAASAGQAAGIDAYAATASYFLTYPEDIHLYGLSWNTQIATTGIAFQGEISYRPNMPLAVDDVEMIFASLSPASPGLAAVNQVVPGGAGLEEVIYGYRRFKFYQAQFTLTKAFSRVVGADQLIVLFEGAYDHVGGMPDQDVLRLDGPGTFTSGNPLMAMPGGAHAGKPAETPEHFATPDSYGYRLVGKLDYLNAIGPWNLAPRFAWQQDLEGITPGPGGNFLEGLYAFTFGLEASYQSKWIVDLSYTQYGGAGRHNLLNDRDFVGAVVKYSF